MFRIPQLHLVRLSNLPYTATRQTLRQPAEKHLLAFSNEGPSKYVGCSPCAQPGHRYYSVYDVASPIRRIKAADKDEPIYTLSFSYRCNTIRVHSPYVLLSFKIKNAKDVLLFKYFPTSSDPPLLNPHLMPCTHRPQCHHFTHPLHPRARLSTPRQSDALPIPMHQAQNIQCSPPTFLQRMFPRDPNATRYSRQRSFPHDRLQ